MKKKIIVFILILLIAAGAWVYISTNKKKNAESKNTIVKLMLMDIESQNQPKAPAGIAAGPDGMPIQSPEEAPECCRELITDTDKFIYHIFDSSDIVIVDRLKKDGNPSAVFKTNHLRGSTVNTSKVIGSCTLETGKDILWLRNKDGILIWGVDLTDTIHNELRRDKVLDVQENGKLQILSLITDTMQKSASHITEILVLDTVVKTTEDSRAIVLRKHLKEYLRSLNINRDEPIPVSGQIVNDTIKVKYPDNTAETFAATN